MQLKTYLSHVNKSVEQFADEVSISAQAVYKYLSGKRVPKKSIIQKIALVTNGQVTADDFYNLTKKSKKSEASN